MDGRNEKYNIGAHAKQNIITGIFMKSKRSAHLVIECPSSTDLHVVKDAAAVQRFKSQQELAPETQL